MARRRTSLSYRPPRPKRTPLAVYIVLVLLCLGGWWYSKQGLVKTVSGTVFDAYSGQPLIGANVVLNNDKRLARTAGIPETARILTDNSGRFEFLQATESLSLLAQANNYRNTEITLSGVYTSSLKLVPTLLRGQVKNETGAGVPRALVTLGTRTVESSLDGSFSFADAPETGTLSVKAPGFRRNSVPFEKTIQVDIPVQSFKVKAVYLAPADIAGPTTFANAMNGLSQTDITGVIVDIKDESGKVLFDSRMPTAAAAIAGNDKKIPNLASLMKTFQDKKLYTIARIVCFQDPVLTDLKPEWALKSRSTGKLWADRGGYNWINPYLRESWDYYLGLAEEAARAGFDEIQFAGLHFPILGKLDDIEYRLPEGRIPNAETRMAAINSFLKMARDRLGPLGVYTSVVVLGTSLIEGGDLGIGMDVALLATQADYITPILYPIEWGAGAFGIPNPATTPYELVRQAMLSARAVFKERLSQVRPQLQDFTRNNVPYGEKEVRDEIRSVEEWQGKDGAGWILYNPNSKYTTAALTAPK